MMKEITVREFVKELYDRIDKSKGIDCCKDEIKKLAKLAEDKIPDATLTVDWKP